MVFWMKEIKNIPIGVIVISICFCVYGLFYFPEAVNILSKAEEFNFNTVSPLIFAVLFLISALGLILKAGWGRNLAIAHISLFLLFKIIDMFSIAYLENVSDAQFMLRLLLIISAVMILLYLRRKDVEKIYPENPLSLFLIGSTLVFCAVSMNTSGNLYLSLIGVCLLCIGFRMVFDNAKQVRHDLGIEK